MAVPDVLLVPLLLTMIPELEALGTPDPDPDPDLNVNLYLLLHRLSFLNFEHRVQSNCDSRL
jgi:hypothetical protein